ncbi:MAG: HIT domain-containing protein [Saprospiraceae bacterium]
MASGIFSKIIKGEISSYKIAEDDNHYAFLDINPLAKGHTLVIPKAEVDYIFDLNDDDLAALHLFSKKVAVAIKKTINCKRVGVLVIGTEVPHAHIHLIPFVDEKQMAITSPKIELETTEMVSISTKIRNAYQGSIGKKTLVFGASTKVERYSNKAMRMLEEYNHPIVAIGGRISESEGVPILVGHPIIDAIDTVTIYMGMDRQKDHEAYILSLNPKRIIFNPGAENHDLYKKADDIGIEVLNACTLVLLRSEQY